MPRKPIPFSSLNIKTLVAIHNELAAERGVELLKSWRGSFVELARRTALLNTRKPLPTEPPPAPPKRTKLGSHRRKQPIRDAILEALAFVSHYEHAESGNRVSKFAAWRHSRDQLVAIGLPYSEVAKRVRVAIPDANISGTFMRWTATQVRKCEPGFEHCKLPQKRPHGTKRKNHE